MDWTRVSCIGRQNLYHWATREAPMMFILNSLLGNLYISVSSSFWRFILFFFWSCLPVPLCVISLCVGVCVFEKIATSPIFHGPTWYSERPSPISMATDSGVSETFYRGICLLWSYTCNFSVRLASFSFRSLWVLVPTGAYLCWCMLSGSVAAGSSTLFSSQWHHQASNVCLLSITTPVLVRQIPVPWVAFLKGQSAGAHYTPLFPSWWSVFIMAALKSFLDNSSIYVISILVSIDCVHLLSLRYSWFFVWWVIFCCILDILGIMRPCIFYQYFLSVGQLWDCSGAWMEAWLHYCQVWVGVKCSHS